MNIAFTPARYEHTTRFVGRAPWDVSRVGELLVGAHRAAWLECRHQNLTAGVDIYNLEAEVYSAGMEKSDGNGIPVIYQPLLIGKRRRDSLLHRRLYG
jgi:hypothetical protein